MLRREMRPVSMKVIEDAANALLSRRKPPGPPVSGSWVRRWLRADRAQARAEASSTGTGALPGIALIDAEIENDDEYADLGEDAPSEAESTELNVDTNGDVSLNLGAKATTSKEQLVHTAAETPTSSITS
jgi:hypothetical protein